MSYVVNYRDHEKGQKFWQRTVRQTEPGGFLVKAQPGRIPVLEMAMFSGRVVANADMVAGTQLSNDIANLRLCTVDANGNPVTPVLEPTVTGGTSTTVFATGLAMTLNEHAGRLWYARSGTAGNIGQMRVIASNTTGGEITLSSALTTTPAAGDTGSILPRNTADALWTATTFKPLIRGYRLQLADLAQTLNRADRALEIALGENQGIGWWAFEHDNFASTTDLTKWAEFSLAVMGRIEAVGYRSNANDYQLQPSGGG